MLFGHYIVGWGLGGVKWIRVAQSGSEWIRALFSTAPFNFSFKPCIPFKTMQHPFKTMQLLFKPCYYLLKPHSISFSKLATTYNSKPFNYLLKPYNFPLKPYIQLPFKNHEFTLQNHVIAKDLRNLKNTK